MRILVVDDNGDLRETLQLLLQHAGYQAETARDGHEALRKHRLNAYQVLLTDIYMPLSDGLETIQAFRRETPGMRIIAMSGGGDFAKGRYLGVASVAGADATLEKPFAFESLVAALKKDGNGAT
jgi:DNA-binding response OmpR family regulator